MLLFLLRTLSAIYNVIRQEYKKITHSNRIETPAVLQGAQNSGDTRNKNSHFPQLK